jgi:hypothetical protein
MIKYYRNKEKDEVLYRYCKNEGLDYLYLLNEIRNAERMNGLYAKVLRKLITSLRKRFSSDGLNPKT